MPASARKVVTESEVSMQRALLPALALLVAGFAGGAQAGLPTYELTIRSRAIAGKAVLRMVPSRVCMKNAIATSQGSTRAVLASSTA